MSHKAPGRSDREGISLLELADMFPTEEAAVMWFEKWTWPDGEINCLRCGSCNAYRVKSGKPMPYRCRDCRKYFSLKTNTAMEASNLPLRKWAYAIYLEITSLKGVSSLKLRRDLKIAQSSAWFMLHRIRQGLNAERQRMFEGPVEVDESYFGGKRKSMSNAKRKELQGTGRGPVGKAAVVGVKDRATGKVAAQVIKTTDAPTLRGFVDAHADPAADVYTDGATAYKGRKNHEAVKHSVGEYVRYLAGATVHTNGVESFWSMLKRGYMGVYHRMSHKHLQRYVNEFAGRHNIRDMDTIDQMAHVVAGMVGRRLAYRDLTADNGRSRVAS
ncbi:MAG: IS1595 family transposase [Gammaproteobacteria bacterium]|nr:IS1595 family transposase [Gammaproteobacteria bacterium]